MKVFVTGATGFIGKHLVRRLIAEGHQVRCLVRPSSQTAALRQLGVELSPGDVNNDAALQAGMAGCDWVFHLANLYSMWEPDPERFTRINVAGTRSVLSAARAARVRRVIYVSTVAVYGEPAEKPFDETCQPGPELFSAYARTKAAAERLAWEFYCDGLPLVVLYPGIVLGAGDEKASGHYIQDIIRRRVPSTIFHNSTSIYVYVEDVVDALLCAAANPRAVGQKYLLGKYALTGREFADLVSQVSGVPLPPFRFPDWLVISVAYLLTGLAYIFRRPPLWGLSIDASQTLKHGFCCDGSKAERELGIHYTPVRQALEAAITSYRQQWALKRSKKR